MLRFKPLARQDLLDIEEFIAEDNPAAGAEFTKMLKQKCGLLADNPYIGAPRFDLATNIRIFPVGDYNIYYQPIENGAEIARIVHASKDMSALTF